MHNSVLINLSKVGTRKEFFCNLIKISNALGVNLLNMYLGL